MVCGLRRVSSPKSRVSDPDHLISIPVLPTLLRDVTDAADKWDKSGRIDPFTEIYDVGILNQIYILSRPFAELPFLARFPHDRPLGLLS